MSEINFITKREMSDILNEAVKLGIFNPSEEHINKAAEELSQLIFDGDLHVNFPELQKDIKIKKAEIEKNELIKARSGGLDRQELEDKIMQGIVNGALGIEYGQIAPYSHGYEVTFGEHATPGSTRNFTNRWECYTSNGQTLFDIPHMVIEKIINDKQNDEVFGRKCGPINISAILKRIDDYEKDKITSFTPANQTDLEYDPNSYYVRNSVATVMHVHAGIGLDGIVKHHYHGTYSTCTPVRQNSLVEALVCMKGFCLDAIHHLDVYEKEKEQIIDYLKKQGTDISTPEKLKEWIENNPDKCAYEENRVRRVSLEKHKPLTDKIEAAKSGTQNSHSKTKEKQAVKEPEL